MSHAPAAKMSTITRSYTIAFTMRSGSNEICKLLWRNGLGVPGESFQEKKTFEEFSAIVQQNQANGIFGSKMSHDHRAALDEQLRKHVAAYRTLDDVLPNHRWVWLRRNDKVLQALSLCRAEQSQIFASEQNRVGKFEPTYDFFHILSRVQLVCAADLAWEVYFQNAGIKPLTIYYEDFFTQLDVQLPRLIDHLGGLPSGSESRLADKNFSYEILRDAQTEQFRGCFMRDLARFGERIYAEDFGQRTGRWMSFFFNFGWRVLQS